MLQLVEPGERSELNRRLVGPPTAHVKPRDPRTGEPTTAPRGYVPAWWRGDEHATRTSLAAASALRR